MRSTFLLPIFALLAAPAAAQSGYGPLVDGPPGMMTPVDGWAVDAGGASPLGVPGKLAQARSLVAQGQYAQADPLLNDLIGRTSSRQVRFLKGVTALGLDQPETARRYFKQALPNSSYGAPGTMSGLALAEIRLGNADAARDILHNLRLQQEKCGTNCDRAQALDQAVGVVERALI